MTVAFRRCSLAEKADLIDQMNHMGGEAWPEFLLHDPVALEYWGQLTDAFKEYQLLILEGETLAAIANTVPLRYCHELTEQPDEGVDWGIKKALFDHEQAATPNVLMAVQVVVGKSHRSRGLSTFATAEMLKLAGRHKLPLLIVPLRPSNKHEYPLIELSEYMQWKGEDGLPFDNWLRIHIRAGGRIVGVCSHSMSIPGAVREWEQLTGQQFPGSGSYIVPGALNPVSIDIENDTGTYIEPNIWLVHDTGHASP